MFDCQLSANLYKHIFHKENKAIYGRLANQTGKTLERYKLILEPKGFLEGLLLFFNPIRQIKIAVLEEILSNRKEQCQTKHPITAYEHRSVNAYQSDLDMLLAKEQVRRETNRYNLLLEFMSRGYYP